MVFLVAQDRGFPGFGEVGRHIENVALENLRRWGLWIALDAGGELAMGNKSRFTSELTQSRLSLLPPTLMRTFHMYSWTQRKKSGDRGAIGEFDPSLEDAARWSRSELRQNECQK